MGNYLLTGVAGFIGSKVCQMLLAEGHSVIGVDNLNDAYDQRLKYWRLSQFHDHPNFQFTQVDICNRDALDLLLQSHCKKDKSKVDAIINLAARAGVRQSVENPWVYIDTNTTGTLNLLELCRKFEIEKFVLASTSSLYGKSNDMPYHESADTNQLLSPYAASKKAAELLCYTYHTLYNIDSNYSGTT